MGDSVEALEAATWAIPVVQHVLASRPAAKPVRSPSPLRQALEDTLLLLCAAPLATVDEMSRFGRIPISTLRDRLKKLARMGMADSVPHSLTILGPHPHLRYFPTAKGIEAGGRVDGGIAVTVGNGSAAVPDLVNLLHDCRIPVVSLSVKRPTLDDVFLLHTGRRIRTEESEG